MATNIIGKLTDDRVMSCSRLPALMGESGFSTPSDELRKSINSTLGIPDRSSAGEAADWGNRFEDSILIEMGERLNLGINHRIMERFEHATIPLQGSMDGVLAGDGRIFKTNPETGIYVIGAKQIRLEGAGVAEAKLTSAAPADEPPPYRGPLQVQGLMMCSGFRWAAIGVLYRGTEMRIYLYSPEPALVSKIEADVIDFDRRVRLHKTDGVTDWYPALTKNDGALTYAVGEDDLPPIKLKGFANQAALSLIEAREARASLDKLIDASTTTIMDQMGCHSTAHAHDSGVHVATISWGMTSPRKEYTVPARPAARSKSLRIKMLED